MQTNTKRIEMCIYKPGEMNLQTSTYLDEKGVERCMYSGLTVVEYLASKEPGFVHISFDEAFDQINAAQDAKFIKPWHEITGEQYDYALNVLPPEKWEFFTGGDIFRMCEYTTGNITAHYVKLKTKDGIKYFCADRRTSANYNILIEELHNDLRKKEKAVL